MASSQACSSAFTSIGASADMASPSLRAAESMTSPVPAGSTLGAASVSSLSPESSPFCGSPSPDGSVSSPDW